MQKLVTIHFDDDNDDQIGISEHLEEYLEEGWRVVQMVPLGSGVSTGTTEQTGYVSGWLAVLLESDEL
jgi:hypothetical protein